MKQYLNLAQRIINEGTWINNKRTGTSCLTVLNHTLTYDISKGELPLVTTRKSFWKAAVAELLGYLRGYTDNADFVSLGTNTWTNNSLNPDWTSNPNCRFLGDLGEAYRFRNLGHYIPLTPAIFDKPTIQSLPRVNNPILPDEGFGQVYSSKQHGEYIVLKDLGKSKDKRIHYLKIQFLISGFVTTIQKSQIKQGNIKDLYSPSVNGIACIGEYSGELNKLLYKTWRGMIERCYNTQSKFYKNYGAKGIFVCDPWLNFSNFVADFTKIYNWELKQIFPKDYSIDKDWCYSNMYSPDTCRWSTKTEQARNTTHLVIYEIPYENQLHYVKGIKGIQEILGVSEGIALRRAKKLKIMETMHIAYVEVDQLKTIYAKLKLGIDDRRLIASAHNPHLNEYCALPACMFQHQFSLLNDTLYLTSYQRSCDIPLGGNFNMVQCAVLLAIMAQVTGHKAGTVTHHIINAHIYEPQIDLMKNVQLKREPLEPPTFKINPRIKTWDDVLTMTTDDVEVFNYIHHEAIKYPFTV